MRKHDSEVIDFINGDLDLVRDELERIINADISDMATPEMKEQYSIKKKLLVRAICDYISGMTDSYAYNEHRAIYG
jgi:dGTPase